MRQEHGITVPRWYSTRYNIGPKLAKEVSSDFPSIRKRIDLTKLTVNKEKCEYVCFGRVQPLGKEAFGDKVSLEGLSKYLGVTIDRNLNFKDHVSHVTKKLNKFCGFMYNLGLLYTVRYPLLF